MLRTVRSTAAACRILALMLAAVGCATGGHPKPTHGPEVEPSGVEAGGLVRMDGGFWTLRRDSDALSESPSAELLALPYVTGANRPAGDRGVTTFDAPRAGNGLNLYTSAHAPEAYLMDMRGTVLHRWTYDRDAVWPQLTDEAPDDARHYFRRVHLFPNGDLLAIYGYTGIIRLDRDSKLLWAHLGQNHHDLDVDAEGRIFVLGTERKVVPGLGEGPISADNVTVLSPAGEVLARIEIADCVLASDPRLVERARKIHSPDVFHANTVEVLDGSEAARAPMYAAGNLLVSLRNMGVVGIIDPRQGRFVWAQWGPWSMQHEPVLLAGGNILLFDNRTVPADRRESGSSRVIEFDPRARRTVWEYAGTADHPLYSSLCGTAARLDNGDTLITESDYGRAIEVTPDGTIVWEFRNPNVAGPNGEYVALVPEMIRLPLDFPQWDLQRGG